MSALLLSVMVVLVMVVVSRETSTKCDINVDITDGVHRQGGNITKDGLTFAPHNYFRNGNEIRGCVCEVTNCVRKCCLENETLDITANRSECVSFSDGGLVPGFETYNLITVPGRQICSEESVNITLNPTLHDFMVDSTVLRWTETDLEFEFGNFCIANVNNQTVAIVCVREDIKLDGILLAIGMIISMPFLVATLLVYAVLPDRNLHQKALMCYVFFLLFAYVFLVTIQLSTTQFDYVTCNFLGFSTLFCFMVSFFWMNVICLDIWFTFSGSRGLGGSKRQSERRRFLYYCAYAIGLPSLHIIIAVLINELGDEEQWYHPNVGKSMCFLESGLANLIYMYGPIAILLTINVLLFTLTAFKIRQVKKETSMLKHSDSKRHNLEKDKQKFNLYLKLLLAMGVNWSMEVISWAVEWRMQSVPRYVWYLTDLCNALYGVFIFVIFVFKKKIWRLLQTRYYSFMGKPHLGHSITTTRSTRTSNYSSGVYSNTDTAFSSASNRPHATATRPEEVALNRM